jgi:hypothetical protein
MSRELAAFVCSHIFDSSRPVLLVARERGDWMFLCGQVHGENEEYHIVGANHLLERDPTLRELANLSDNTEAERETPVMPWIRRPLAPE